ncbi:SDR family oxidoreductase [Mesorhizobium sp. M2A.F.Ca.ET.042.01.1.1]|uniref:SDR family oxidoreductase n=1 Tax=Mesorhizobium sp. M2A.F.Ca.ET.042.01.1.1 TaxID=2496745 RepID=UPI000FCA7D4A|nr:SDR family oxidoreductase [Mesorhizobium sp. M2A.F.Ca.ET.042.01.1.1]RUX26419.1 SDR family oxidoreductase [Mesorhizobium sp. M2A.F.Ca.ET.042.01.1.1]
MTSLAGKKIIVVGGSSGIGFGVAAAALEHGAEVVIVGRSEDKLKAAEERLGAGHVTAIAADMANEADVSRMFEQAGAFDHLVATAGTPPPNDPIGETDMDFVRGFVDGKLIGSVMLAKHAVRKLNKGGSMIFTSGVNKDRPPVPGGAVVAAVAGSFSYFARALALELAPTRVNIVSPGWVDTEMWDEIVGEAKTGYFEQMGGRIPAGRIARPADIAPAYLYLMQNKFMTGETVHIDGGQRLV